MDLRLVHSPVERTISGFDGSKSRSSKETQLLLDSDSDPTTFIITRLKDAYDGILGMPWIRKHGHRIDWRGRQLTPSQTRITAVETVSPPPPKTSQDGEEPDARQARRSDEGVPASCGITPPRCESIDKFHPVTQLGATGKRIQLLGQYTEPTPIHQTDRTCEDGDRPEAGHIRTTPLDTIAAAVAASSMPTRASSDGEEPVGRYVRQSDEGVPAISGITPPRCESTNHSSPDLLRATGKRACPLGHPPQGPRVSYVETAGQGTIAAIPMASSIPKGTSSDGEEPVGRPARLNDEGVRNLCAITPPRCESNTSSTHQMSIRTTGKRAHPVGLHKSATMDVAKVAWSTSAQLAAQAKQDVPPKSVEELVPRRYHRHLGMFKKTEAQRLPPRRKYDFRVDLIPGAVPHASRIIPLSPAENEALDTLIREGLEHGTILRTTSPWAAPVLFTGKKDGNLRPCFDYRRLNAVTVKNKYPLPLTMDLVDSLLDADTFTKLDLRNAYGNLRVAEGDEEKLAFVCRAGQFAPLTMPFGPTGAPGFFQFFIQDILLGRIGKDTAAYLDDIMIYTQRGTDHEGAVEEILEILSKHQLWLKPEKCEFSRAEVEYLGLLISCNRVRMDPAKVKAVSDWPAPTNVTELQRFIGFANFYRRFISHFSRTTRPLHDLTKSGIRFVWDKQCDEAFESLKTLFTLAPILKIADPYKPFLLECDCSDFALGAVLSQVCTKDNDLHPVAYLSRSLIQAERNYEIFDKELLAIVAAFKEWRHYLEGNPNRLKAIVYTDHRNLESFMTSKSLTRQQARWAKTLGNFDFEIIFRPGRQATKPDALSRRPDLAPKKEEKLTFGQLLKPLNITPETFAAIAEIDEFFVDESVDLADADHWFEVDILGVEQTDDKEVGEDRADLIPTDADLISLIRAATLTDPRLTHLISKCQDASTRQRDYSYKDGVLYNQGRIEVPKDKSLKTAILRTRHDCRPAGHPGRAKTLALVRRCFNWPGQKKFVNRYVDGCGSCQRVKGSTQKPFGTLEPLPIPAGPWTDISYDMITDLPESNNSDSILTVVDRLTKMAHFIPCNKTMTAEHLADLLLRQVWKLHGTPKTIVSDRGSVFISQTTKELSKRLGIRLCPSTAYHPRTDGQSEIVNKAIEQYLRHFVGYHQDDWEGLLAVAEFSHNNQEHVSIGMSPFRANYGFDLTYGGIQSSKQCLPLVEKRLQVLATVQEELKATLEAAQASMKLQFNRKVAPTPKWQVGDAGVHPTFHVSVLQKHTADTIEGREVEEPQPVMVEGAEEWEVAEILDYRRQRQRKEYLVAWKGYGPEGNSWEPESNLRNCQQLVTEFDKNFPEAAVRHRRRRRFK
ncbi:hypothetical protein PtA15_5A350 [Puccinia triticina]|uniref:Reverse transcriptase n=1 Tax=Puccinia triticina TaxID=208348 RepID=A0ABY7CPU1_9BASI|nr:uncharacterized protein PtA15_5A350 [Puccinia triticina]WAQ84777.1 hypothetical protein PtA15_5A350 [Puccinia triticina]